MTTATHPQAPGGGLRTGPPQFTRTTEQEIDGRYRPITTHQIAMTWWLHQSGRITRRQLRVTFAAHELAEQRRYASPERRGHARYTLHQLRRLVGGTGTPTADRDLSADVRRLRELGLVTISSRSITFATSIEQIHLEDDLADFWTFFQALPHPRRRVPVPRRTLRALAAGFSRGVTAYILASLIRSVFWQRHPTGGGGEYRVDGRTKGSWIAQTFGVSRRAVTEARARLIELGWLEPIETQQWELNRWGVHDVVNVHWSPSSTDPQAPEGVDNSAVGEGSGSGGSATPRADSSGGSATPCLNRSALPTGDSKTRRLWARAPSPPGVCIRSRGSRKKNQPTKPKLGKPNIRDIQPADLADTDRLVELRTQALKLGMAFEGESGERDFFALAHRARARGQRPAALFFDLISKHRTAFITIADEEEACRRLKEHRYGPEVFRRAEKPRPSSDLPSFTEDERIVLACQKRLPGHKPEEVFRLARRHLDSDWTLDRWLGAHLSLLTKDARRWAATTVGDEMGEMYR